MKNTIATLFGLSALFSLGAQSLKPIDYQLVYRDNNVSYERIEVVSFDNGVPADTCLVSEIYYDAQGQMVNRVDYFACGMALSREQFFYSEDGRLDSNIIEHVFDKFTPRHFQLKYDTEGRVVQRELDQTIRNYWSRERYTYNGTGEVEMVDQYRRNGDQLIQMKSVDYAMQNREMHKETSVMFLRMENGLLLVENVYSPQGLTRMVIHTYQSDSESLSP
ncbi:MAG: hypothetical protein KDC12_09325 [Flavobacteriales bacterium]|nr:hypothetical protein [Flavobacteriales bacterium]